MQKTKIIVRDEKILRSIDVSSLLAVTVDDYMCCFYIENEKELKCSMSLTSVIDQLPSNFMRIKRNCVINTEKMKMLDMKKRIVTLSKGINLIFSSRKSKEILEVFRKN
jgi:DNA-binding LytR/AlgR family response regulator